MIPEAQNLKHMLLFTLWLVLVSFVILGNALQVWPKATSKLLRQETVNEQAAHENYRTKKVAFVPQKYHHEISLRKISRLRCLCWSYLCGFVFVKVTQNDTKILQRHVMRHKATRTKLSKKIFEQDTPDCVISSRTSLTRFSTLALGLSLLWAHKSRPIFSTYQHQTRLFALASVHKQSSTEMRSIFDVRWKSKLKDDVYLALGNHN